MATRFRHDRGTLAALLTLWRDEALRRRGYNAEVVGHLVELGWVVSTRRAGEFRLAGGARPNVERRLDALFEGWRTVDVDLAARGLPLTPQGLRRLASQRRAEELGPLGPVAALEVGPRVNRRTVSGALADHSKAALTGDARVALDEVALTRDDVLRLRPTAGLLLRRGSEELDACSVARVLGEVVLSERALLDGLALGGVLPRAVLTVENSGPYVDLEAPDDLLVVHAPGTNTRLARRLIAQLDVPVFHFGDLDPNGLRAFLGLRRAISTASLWVPDIWAERLTLHALAAEWPDDLPYADLPPLVGHLRERGLALEQEPLVLDRRFAAALAALPVNPGDSG